MGKHTDKSCKKDTYPQDGVEDINALNNNRVINVEINCNGSNVGNGVGIGNGVQNGGGGASSNSGQTGTTAGFDAAAFNPTANSNRNRNNSDILDNNRVINIVLNCNGSNIGNGVGIGNGNQNGGGGSCDGGGQTGQTGQTGGGICNACNLSCEQIFLEQFADPDEVSRVGQEIVWTLRATNISAARIEGPLVISSSFFGTQFLTEEGIAPGETITIEVRTLLDEEDVQRSEITSVAYVARGIPTGIPGRFDVGERISPIVTTTVRVNVPNLDISGVIDLNLGGRTLSLTLRNLGTQTINFFQAPLENIFGTCASLTIPLVGSPFMIIPGSTGFTGATGPILTFGRGRNIPPGQSASVVIEGELCVGGCSNTPGNQCILNYRFAGDQTAIISRSVAIPTRAAGGG